jgi:hypothetical protein
VVAVVAAAGAVGATTLLSQRGTVTVETGSGLTVRVTEQAGLPSGNPFGPQSFKTGEANVSSPDGGELTLEATPNRGGAGFVVISQVDAGSGRLDVATPGSREIGLASGATASELRVNSTVNFTDNTTAVDARVSSSGGTTLAVNAAELDTGVVAVDADSGAPLDAGVKSADGQTGRTGWRSNAARRRCWSLTSQRRRRLSPMIRACGSDSPRSAGRVTRSSRETSRTETCRWAISRLLPTGRSS